MAVNQSTGANGPNQDDNPNERSAPQDQGVFEISRAFQFSEHEIRVVGTSEHPQWIAADVCAVLGIKNVSQATERIPVGEKGITKTYTPYGVQEMLTVNEPGLYRLIFRSNKPEAEAFRRWVFHEVLPAIRKHGTYGELARYVTHLEAKIDDQAAKLQQQTDLILTMIDELQPATGCKLASNKTRELPACETNRITSGGRLIDAREIHVTPYRKLNTPTHMMPVCLPCYGKHCNGTLITGEMHGRVEAFALLVEETDPPHSLPWNQLRMEGGDV